MTTKKRGGTRFSAAAPLLLVVGLVACEDQPGPTELAAEALRPAGASHSESAVIEFPAGPVVPGASASLSRTDNGVNARLTTSGLTPGYAYTLWAVVFNKPENCNVPNACTPFDALFNPAAEADLIGVTGLVAGGSGKATFAGRVEPGDVGVLGNGLQDPFTTIHLVVRCHGEKQPGNEQLYAFNGGCPGGVGCVNAQAAVDFN